MRLFNEGLSPDRCPVVRKRGPGRNQATVLKKWLTQDSICVMKCYCQSEPGVRGYRQRLLAFWKEKKRLKEGEQRLCEQVQMIQKKGWLLQPQLKEIRRLAESGENHVEGQQEEQNRNGTETTKQVTEQHFAQDEDEKRREENAEILINYITVLEELIE